MTVQQTSKRQTSKRRLAWLGIVSAAVAAPVVLTAGGCNSDAPPQTKAAAATSQPSSLNMSQRQDAALRDPMDYKPQFGAGPAQGGGITDPSGLKKDLNDVFNP